jgi:predicted nucleic acid-binding protein
MTSEERNVMIFDTDVMVWAIRGRAEAARAIGSSEIKYISAVTYMELVQGAKNKEDLRWIKSFINDIGINIIPIESDISHRACIYMEAYGLRTGIDTPDALIAATAAENGMELCTGNVKDFREIKELKIKVFKVL